MGQKGAGFIETMGVQMEAGRTYSRAYGNEKSKIIFNELAIKKMGLTNPIGKIVHLWGEDREIIGVVKDFNFQSLYENVKPCFFDLAVNQRASRIMVRIKAGQEVQTIDRLAKLYTKDNQGLAFDYRFLDDDYQALYSSERRVAVLIAFPIAWWAMHQWVRGFAYRIEIGFVVFLAAGGAIMLVTALTISYQAIRAAMANPVKSLRAD
jgi:hypothetical protein